jgi:hypothetical protein
MKLFSRRVFGRARCLLVILAGSILGSRLAPASVSLNEVLVKPLPDPGLGEDWGRAEYVELRNDSAWPVDLAGWQLAKTGLAQALLADPDAVSPHGMVLGAGCHALILPHGGSSALARLAASGQMSDCLILRIASTRFLGSGLGDGSGELRLLDKEGHEVSAFLWRRAAERGVSWERPNRSAYGTDDDWLPNRLGGTPGYANLVDPQKTGSGNPLRNRLQLASRIVRAGAPGSISITLQSDESATLQLVLPDGTVRRTLLSRFRTAGLTQIALDGSDDGGLPLPGGLYLVALSINGRMAAVCALVLERRLAEGGW